MALFGGCPAVGGHWGAGGVPALWTLGLPGVGVPTAQRTVGEFVMPAARPSAAAAAFG